MNAIVAVDRNWAIGRGGQLLYHVRADLANFKKMTMGHPLVVGRRTLEGFPGGKPLPGRPHYVLTHDAGLPTEPHDDVRVMSGIDDLLASVPADAFVAGGASVYEQLLPECERAYVTRILDAANSPDAWFPDLDDAPCWLTEDVALLQDAGPDGPRAELWTYRNLRYEPYVYETGIGTPGELSKNKKVYVGTDEKAVMSEAGMYGRDYLVRFRGRGPRCSAGYEQYDFAARKWKKPDGAPHQ